MCHFILVDAKPSAEALKTYAFFRISDQQMPKDQGQELNVIREAQEGQEGEVCQEDLESHESTFEH